MGNKPPIELQVKTIFSDFAFFTNLTFFQDFNNNKKQLRCFFMNRIFNITSKYHTDWFQLHNAYYVTLYNREQMLF